MPQCGLPCTRSLGLRCNVATVQREASEREAESEREGGTCKELAYLSIYLFLSIYLSIYLSIVYLCIYLSV